MSLAEHLARHTLEAAQEGFAVLDPDGLARLYAPENLVKSLTEPGWCRLWTAERDGQIIAHASVYDLGEHEIVFGHIGIEREHRQTGIARELQALRFAFLDEHGLVLTGPIAPGNTRSLNGCLKNGFQVLRVDPDGTTWVYREPGAQQRT